MLSNWPYQIGRANFDQTDYEVFAMNQQAGFDPISWAVRDDKAAGVFRVHRRASVDQPISELERERIFGRC